MLLTVFSPSLMFSTLVSISLFVCRLHILSLTHHELRNVRDANPLATFLGPLECASGSEGRENGR